MSHVVSTKELSPSDSESSNSPAYSYTNVASGKEVLIKKENGPKPLFPVCTDCLDTNSHIRDESLALKQTVKSFKKKYSLSLSLRDIEEQLAIDRSIKAIDQMDDGLYSAVVIGFVIIGCFSSLIYLLNVTLYRKKSLRQSMPIASKVENSKNSENENRTESPPGITAQETLAETVPMSATSAVSVRATSYQVHDFHENPMLSTGLTISNDFRPSSELSQFDAKSEASSMNHDNRSDTSFRQKYDFLHSNFSRSLQKSQYPPSMTASSIDSFSDNSDLVTPNTKRNRKQAKISDSIMKHIKKVHTTDEYKNDLAFILFVCNIVETTLGEKQDNTHASLKGNEEDSFNNKQLVVDALMKIFTYNEDELEILVKGIDYLYSKGLIKKDPYVEKFQLNRKRKV